MNNLLEVMMEARRRIDALGPIPPNIRLVSNASAVKAVAPLKTYARRRAKSKAHWHRINKKWLSRFGYRYEPAAYSFPDGKGDTLIVVHPLLYPKYKAALESGKKSLGL